jgi:L-alanine-DL-glutamate epimerase-like enolase superfamily enzyme
MQRYAAMDLSYKPKDMSENEYRYLRNRKYDIFNIAHPFTGIHITEKGLELLEQYVADVRSVIGYEVPLAIDHFGHIGFEDCIRLGKRIEKYNLAWMEDMIPWQYTEQYARLARSVQIPICTGEDIYLKENFRQLLEAGGVSVIHPDILTSGGIPLVQNGFIVVPDGPGLGIESLNDEVISQHIHPGIPGVWLPTEEWNQQWSHDRLWS